MCSKKICRVCLCFNLNLISIIKDESIKHKIMECAPVEITDSDELPSMICQECIVKLNEAYEFRLLIMQSDMKLKKKQFIKESTTQISTKSFIEEHLQCKLEINETLSDFKKEDIKNDSVDGEQVYSNVSTLCESVLDQDFLDHADLNSNSFGTSVNIKTKFKLDKLKVKQKRIASKNRKQCNDKNIIKKQKDAFCREISSFLISKIIEKSDDFYTCLQCGEELTEAFLRDHIKLHNKKIKWSPECVKCGKSFKSRSQWKEHCKIFHPNILCEDEIIKFKNKQSNASDKCKMENKIKENVFENNKKIWTCEECGDRFPSEEHFTDHFKTHEKMHLCCTCGKAFTNTKDFGNHVKVHDKKRPHVCQECGKSFRYPNQLQAHHKITHTGMRPHVCHVCGKTFSHSSTLNVHVKRHLGVRPHMCTICNKAFVEKNKLIYHMRSHTGEQPFACEYCGRCFSCKWNLTQHLRLHTDEKPYRCKYCPLAFTHNVTLKQHTRNKHPSADQDLKINNNANVTS